MIKVAIVDDHKLFRQGLSVILNSKEGIEIVGRFESAIDFIEQLPSLEIDLVLLDIDMPDMDGITACPKILKLQPSIKIVILSMHLNSNKVREAVVAKVKGYLLKTSSDDEVVSAINIIMEGKEFFSKEAQEELINSYKKEDSQLFQLTPREKEILKLVCAEYNSHEIAEELNISTHTADTHRRNLMSKTGSKNSIGLVKYAIENNLI
jgi:DNA-binding NarL/FixJ family response regulator